MEWLTQADCLKQIVNGSLQTRLFALLILFDLALNCLLGKAEES